MPGSHPASPTKYQALTKVEQLSQPPPTWWRPRSFRRTALLITIICACTLLAIVVVSHVQAYRTGAVLVAEHAGGLSDGQIFLFQYMPTMLIVCFAMWVSVIDLDVKRLEPWYQLSHPDSSSHSPLLCRYDTDFFLAVLFRSLRRRHVIVFSSSLLLVLTTNVIPAVQNSMLLARQQLQPQNIVTSVPAPLISMEAQTTTMNSKFLNTAYSMCWLGQNAPAFTTRSYAIAPFTYVLPPEDIVETTVTTSTTMYWAELNCWRPTSIAVQLNATQSWGHAGLTVSFDDGRGCNASDILLIDADVSDTYPAKYETYYMADHSIGYASPGYSLQTVCPQFPHMFLAVWKLQGLEPPDFRPGGNATAMFCEPQYYMQPVQATVSTSNNSIKGYEATKAKQRLPDDLFNSTRFEYIVTNGSPSDNLTALSTDIVDEVPVLQLTRLENANVSAPTAYSSNSMIGFMLGVSQLPGYMYFDYETFNAAYVEAYQLLFASAMTYNFDIQSNASQQAVLNKAREVVALVPAFAVVTEILLVVVIVGCTHLFYSLPRRTLHLCKNPDSLAQVMVLARDQNIQKVFARVSAVSDRQLEHDIKSRSFNLRSDSEGIPLLILNDNQPSEDSVDAKSLKLLTCDLPEVSWTVTSLVAVVIAASIAIFSALYVLSTNNDGLVVPSTTEFVLQILLSFLPTAFATLLGAYINLLCRIYSFMRPMEDLYRGNASAKATLLVTYSSLPPPLVFLKALPVGHYLLASLSIMALLSNVLTVTLASIFFRQDVALSFAWTFQPLYTPFVLSYPLYANDVGSDQVDSLYPVVANVSDQTELPTWTTSSYGYLPIGPGSDVNKPISELEYESLGYGADFDCINLLSNTSQISSTLIFDEQGQNFVLTTNFTMSGGNTCQCSSDWTHNKTICGNQYCDAGFVGGSLSETASAFEIVGDYRSSVEENRCDFCQDRIVQGWVRGRLVPNDPVPSTNQTATNHHFEYNATIIACQARLRTQKSLLRITPTGNILATQPLGDPSYDIPPTVNFSATLDTSVNVLRGLLTNGVYPAPTWHNDSIARDYSNYLYKKMIGTNDLLDPTIPVPSFNTASAIVSDALSRLFAVQLFIDRGKLVPITSTTTNTTTQPLSSTTATPIPGKATLPSRRIFLSPPMLITSLTLLTLNLILVLIFRINLPAPSFLPRKPFTIASQIAFFAGSRVMSDVVRARDDLDVLDRLGRRYGFGKTGGEGRRGIEWEEHVFRDGVRKVSGRRSGWLTGAGDVVERVMGWKGVLFGRRRKFSGAEREERWEFDDLSSR